MKFEITIRGRVYTINLYTYEKLDTYVAGITNRCRNGSYVLFIDYDEVPEEWVLEELDYLQETYHLGNIHVFKTNKGYHAICTDKLRLSQLITIMRQTSTDAAYLEVPLRRARKVWTLRTSMKDGQRPSYLVTLKSSSSMNLKSAPHNDILRKMYKLNIPKDCEDGETAFWTGHYHIGGGV